MTTSSPVIRSTGSCKSPGELRKLVPEQQAALVLVDMLGYSVSDAAEVLGVSESTAKSGCARGRARLLPRLAQLRPLAIPSQGRRNRIAGPPCPTCAAEE